MQQNNIKQSALDLSPLVSKLPIIIGLDPGFANLGIAIIHLHASWEEVIELRTIQTKKSTKKRNVRASDDNVRRIIDLATHLTTLCEQYKPIAICTESQSWPRNASSSAKVGMMWGVIGTTAAIYNLPVLQATPMEIKRAVAGIGTASKIAVQAALNRRYTELPWPEAKTKREHVGDALGAIIACLDSNQIKLARQMLVQREG